MSSRFMKFFLFPLACLWMSACVPNFERAGDDGGKVPRGTKLDADETITRDPFHVFSDENQTQIKCGKTNRVTIVVSEPVRTCEAIDYFAIYQHVKPQIQAAVDNTVCEEGCQKIGPTTYRRLSCENLRATVALKIDVTCLKPGESRKPSLPYIFPDGMKASTETFVTGETKDLTAPEDGELIVETLLEKGATYTIACPGQMTFLLRYEEKDPAGCAGISDFRPYVDRALAAMRARYGYACWEGCAKASEFKVLRTEWKCDPASKLVVVKVTFQSVCEKKP